MPHSRAYDGLKRIVDLSLAILAGLACAPFVVLAVPILWLTQGKVFFRQLRPGLHGRPFWLYKFRTMSEATDERGGLLPDWRRITPVGRVIRKLSIDELPQLWNVIIGDMSLVGPRPLLMEYLPRYSAEQAKRHDVRPGITGWAQINGRNSLSWDEKFQLDVWYVEHRSFSLDLRIMALTVWRVAQRSGISNPTHATMPEFLGSNRDLNTSADVIGNAQRPEMPRVQ